jgi:hypothetical protein
VPGDRALLFSERPRAAGLEPREPRVLLPNRYPAEVADYLAEMMQQLSRHTPAEIKAAIDADWRSSEFLGRLAKSGAAIPEIGLWRRD